MAIVVKSFILKSISGRIGEFVVRQYKDRTIISMRPDRSRLRPSKKQKKHQAKFKRAVKYAQRVMENEKLRARYEGKVKKDKSIFQYLVREYMKGEGRSRKSEVGSQNAEVGSQRSEVGGRRTEVRGWGK